MKIASASPPVVFLLSGHTVVLLVAASVLPVGFSRCGRVPIPALGPYLSPRLAARSACRLPACAPACVNSRIRLPGLRPPCVYCFLSLFSPPGLRPGLHESPHPDKKTTAPTIVEAVCPTLRSPAGREMLWLRAPGRPLSGIRSRVPEPSRKNPCRSRGAGSDGQPAASRR